MDQEEQGLTSQIGALEVDWPRSIGYFGGIWLAVSLDLIAPPVGLFIAAIPFIKMLNRPKAPKPVRLVSQLFDGAAQPVGGDAQGTIRLTQRGASMVAPSSESRRGGDSSSRARKHHAEEVPN